VVSGEKLVALVAGRFEFPRAQLIARGQSRPLIKE
jgi:hypothetical protein